MRTRRSNVYQGTPIYHRYVSICFDMHSVRRLCITSCILRQIFWDRGSYGEGRKFPTLCLLCNSLILALASAFFMHMQIFFLVTRSLHGLAVAIRDRGSSHCQEWRHLNHINQIYHQIYQVPAKRGVFDVSM